MLLLLQSTRNRGTGKREAHRFIGVDGAAQHSKHTAHKTASKTLSAEGYTVGARAPVVGAVGQQHEQQRHWNQGRHAVCQKNRETNTRLSAIVTSLDEERVTCRR